MAKYGKGILGSFNGAVGNVVGAIWNGIPYMRSKPAQVKDRNSKEQRVQRQKFSLITQFLRKVKPVVDAGFMHGSVHMTPFNRASSYNLRNAITGEYPEQQIDFASVLIARGDLTAAGNANAESEAAGELTFSWDDNSGSGSAHAEDKAIVLAFQPETGEAVYRIEETAERQDGSYTMTLPNGLEGESVECYLAFVSANSNVASDSTYLGSVTITE